MMPSMRALAALSLFAVACQHRAGAPASPADPASKKQPGKATPAETPADGAADPQASPPRQPVDTISYRMSPLITGRELTALVVELRFRGDEDGSTRLRLPDEWAGARQLWRNLYDLKVTGATKVEAVDPFEPKMWTIHAPPKELLTVRYLVRSAYSVPPEASIGQPFAPIICPTWFYAFGEAVFATVERSREPKVRFAWGGASSGFNFASDLEHLSPQGGTVHDLLESIVIGGTAVQVHAARGEGNQRLRVAVAGEYTFSPAAFIELAQGVLVAPQKMFGERDQPFLIAVSPLVPTGGTSIGGSSLADAFALSISQDTPLPELTKLISHEYFHTWNPAQLGGLADGEEELRGKWFSEGFTEFYAARLLQRTGRAPLEDFVAAWNETLLAYATSPVRNAPAERITADYWNDPDVGKLPYQRGQLLAALWDHRLRQATGSARDLDDVLLAMYKRVQPPGDRGKLRPPAELFPRLYTELGGPVITGDVDRFLSRGETIELPDDVFGPCVRVQRIQQPAFERGWDAKATSLAHDVVTGLRAGSPAHRAGLRNGMKIVRRTGGTPGDASVRYSLLVHDGRRERTISFMPRGAGTVSTQRLELVGTSTPAARAACARALGGER